MRLNGRDRPQPDNPVDSISRAMKRCVIVVLLLALGGGVIWSERRQLRQALAERERMSIEWKRLQRSATELEAETGRLEAEAASREQMLGAQRRQAATQAATLHQAA